MMHRSIFAVGVLCAFLLTGCGGSGGDSVTPGTNNPPICLGGVGIQSAVPGDGSVTVAYDAATDPDGDIVTYNLYYIDATATGSDNPFAGSGYVKAPGISASPYVIQGLTNEHMYWCGVRASDDKGLEETNTVKLSTIPTPTVNNPPVWDGTIGVQTATPSDSSVTVTYGTATDPEGNNPVIYDLYLVDETATGSNNPFGANGQIVYNIGNSQYLKTGLSNGYLYWFGVRAKDALGNIEQNTNTLSTMPAQAGINPIIVGSVGNVYATDVAVEGDYAYVTDSNDSRLNVVNVADKNHPAITGTSIKFGSPVMDVAVSGNFAYVAVRGTIEWSGLWIFNVTNKNSPQTQGKALATNPYGVAVSGNFAYVTTAGTVANGLKVVDISSISFPYIIGTVNTAEALDVAVSGNYSYIADRETGLKVIDVINPASPYIIGSVDTPGRAWGVAVEGNYAYVADWGKGLMVVDVANKSNPIIVGSVDTPGQARRVVVSGNYAYVADKGAGLQVVNISDKTNPAVVGSIDTNDAVSVAVEGNYAYLADGGGGLKVIKLW